MSQEERYGTRDHDYSAWHRTDSIKRFCDNDNRRARAMSMIDLDASLWIEYEGWNREPLVLIETAIDVGQSRKPATVLQCLARRANLPAYVVLYTPMAGLKNPADSSASDIVRFRVKRLWPDPESEWRRLSPWQWCRELEGVRDGEASRLEARRNLALENSALKSSMAA